MSVFLTRRREGKRRLLPWAGRRARARARARLIFVSIRGSKHPPRSPFRTELGLESPSYLHSRSFVVHSASGGVSPLVTAMTSVLCLQPQRRAAPSPFLETELSRHLRHTTAVDGDSDLPFPHTRDATRQLCSTVVCWGGRFQGELCSQRRPAPSLRNLGQHAPPGGVAALERVDAGGDECAVSLSIAGPLLLVGTNGNLGDRRGGESCLPFRLADQRVRDENAVSAGPPFTTWE
jgi:hypothetical protein